MKSEKQTIGPLKRVTLFLSAGHTPAGNELLDAEPLEFIFGLGKEGLTPLERRLEGKSSGETVTMELFQSKLSEFFGHILPCPAIFNTNLNSFYVNMKIQDINSASPREVIHAMAQTASCGNDCDCGCGRHY